MSICTDIRIIHSSQTSIYPFDVTLEEEQFGVIPLWNYIFFLVIPADSHKNIFTPWQMVDNAHHKYLLLSCSPSCKIEPQPLIAQKTVLGSD